MWTAIVKDPDLGWSTLGPRFFDTILEAQEFGRKYARGRRMEVVCKAFVNIMREV